MKSFAFRFSARQPHHSRSNQAAAAEAPSQSSLIIEYIQATSCRTIMDREKRASLLKRLSFCNMPPEQQQNGVQQHRRLSSSMPTSMKKVSSASAYENDTPNRPNIDEESPGVFQGSATPSPNSFCYEDGSQLDNLAFTPFLCGRSSHAFTPGSPEVTPGYFRNVLSLLETNLDDLCLRFQLTCEDKASIQDKLGTIKDDSKEDDVMSVAVSLSIFVKNRVIGLAGEAALEEAFESLSVESSLLMEQLLEHIIQVCEWNMIFGLETHHVSG